MAQDLRDRHPVAPPPRRDSFLQASQSLPHPQGKPLAAVKAWPSFALDPAPPASLHDPPNTATPPTSATPPAQISQSIAFGRRREGRALLPATELPEQASPSPAVPTILPAKSAPSTHSPSAAGLETCLGIRLNNSLPPPPLAAQQSPVPCGPAQGPARQKNSLRCRGFPGPWKSRTGCEK